MMLSWSAELGCFGLGLIWFLTPLTDKILCPVGLRLSSFHRKPRAINPVESIMTLTGEDVNGNL